MCGIVDLHSCLQRTSGAEAHVGLEGSMRGLKPPPPSDDLCGAAEAAPFQSMGTSAREKEERLGAERPLGKDSVDMS
jgi:hypothetical protein